MGSLAALALRGAEDEYQGDAEASLPLSAQAGSISTAPPLKGRLADKFLVRKRCTDAAGGVPRAPAEGVGLARRDRLRLPSEPLDTPHRGTPHDGRVHDTEALRRCGLLEVPPQDLPDGAESPLHVGDKGCIGLGMITSRRKPANLPLHPDDRTYNRAVNQIRYKIERAIANIKTWRVLHTGCRRPLDTFPETITAILGIIFIYTP